MRTLRLGLCLFSVAFLCSAYTGTRISTLSERTIFELKQQSERWNPTRKNIKICGHEIQVPVIAYGVCKIALAMLPVNCTIGATTSAGASCGSNIGLASASCAVSFAVLMRIAQDCMNSRR